MDPHAFSRLVTQDARPELHKNGQNVRDYVLPRQGPKDAEEHTSHTELGLKPPQLNAFLLLIHLDHAVRQGKTYLSKIFNAENKSRRKEPGEPRLEIGEFYRGLKRIHVIDALDLSEAKLAEALWELDKGFDGRVYLPILDRALKVLASTGEYGPFAYGETSPVRSIDIPMEADSINNFRKAFKCFRDQQNELLTFHSNLKHLVGNCVQRFRFFSTQYVASVAVAVGEASEPCCCD
eukprot:s1838_g3.t1